jgi:hypothetical protein
VCADKNSVDFYLIVVYYTTMQYRINNRQGIEMSSELLLWQAKILDRLESVNSVNWCTFPSTYANEFALAAMLLNDAFKSDDERVRLTILNSHDVSVDVSRGFSGGDYIWCIYLRFRPDYKHYKMLSISDLDFLQCFMPKADYIDFSDIGVTIGEHSPYCESRRPSLQLLVSAFNYYYRAKTVLGTAEWLSHLAVQSQGN